MKETNQIAPLWPHVATVAVATVLSEQKTTEAGLSAAEVSKRQAIFGPNELGQTRVRWYHVLLRQLASPFIYILLATVPLSAFFGETLDAVMIIIFIVINVILGFTQEFRSEKMLAILSSFVVAKARVLRAGKEQLIPSPELVPGDIIVVETGDIVPADARLIVTQGITVNESVLTGESVAVTKTAIPLKQTPTDIYEATNVIFSGTTVVDGKAQAVVIGTGKGSFIGSIAALASNTVRESGFEKGIKSLSQFILRLIFGTLVLVFVANLLIRPTTRDNVVELIVFSIALAISVIPEGLPVVTTFSLSRGAVHLAKKKVVAKRLSAIEDLGGIDILCTDKTGTITENELTVAEYLPATKHTKSDVLCTAALAAPFLREVGKEPNNAFDCALNQELSKTQKKTVAASEILAELPFDPTRRRNVVLVQTEGELALVVRGAYEEIEPLLKSHTKQTEYATWVVEQGLLGRRILAVAKRVARKSDASDLKKAETDLELIGLISFVDPLKSTSREALAEAKQLGVNVKILTGDSAAVAGAVGVEVGLIGEAHEVITGAELFALSVEKQTEAVEKYAVFARVNPTEKYQIIQLLQAAHQVGFLGEGINDAPALKIAHVGLVVAEASDVAREAADVVLLQKSLRVIIDGIREGRIVFVNTITYIKSTLASNLGNFYAVAVASLLIDFLPMLPLQILLLNLLSDFPMMMIATDRVDTSSVRKPKQYDIKEIALIATTLGLVSSLFDFIFFAYFKGLGPAGLQTNWFMGSVITELIFLFSIRTKRWSWQAKSPSRTIWALTIGSIAVTIALPLIPAVREVFKFIQPTPAQYVTVLTIAGLYFVVTEVVKWGYYKSKATV